MSKKKTAAEQWRELRRGERHHIRELMLHASVEMVKRWMARDPTERQREVRRLWIRQMRLAARVLREAARRGR